ncbi:glycosyltransferase [Flavobacterium sp. F52]|uniref:glycosyltransferase n=1 Tax=Flavobacterium sp. F52 TaxID=1202532 RepID=UPI000272FA56|nr:glycosyltransferase [Flavobacterium sp. F52]EJG01879.1 glycosyltransferase [Flavobacterium sp. F52]
MKNIKEDTLLVSIIVITYNSADYVLETLESIKNQTYKNIELIITDDKSKDNTIEICNKWLDENRKEFTSSKIIVTANNSGIPANCNRGIHAAKGDWIKIIAGDDILLPDAIENYIRFAGQNEECEIIHSKVVRMVHRGSEIEKINAERYPKTLHQNMFPKTQFKLLRFSTMVLAPTVFMKKDLLERLDYLDESIKLCEDWPFWLKLTYHGSKFYFLNKEMVLYRIHEKSVYSSNENKFLIAPFHSVEKSIYEKYIRENVNFFDKLIFDYYYALRDYFFRFNDSSFNSLIKFFYDFLSLPYRVYRKLTFLVYNK